MHLHGPAHLDSQACIQKPLKRPIFAIVLPAGRVDGRATARRARVCVHGFQIISPIISCSWDYLTCALNRVILNRRSAAVAVDPDAAACALAFVHFNHSLSGETRARRLFGFAHSGDAGPMCVLQCNPAHFRLAIGG